MSALTLPAPSNLRVPRGTQTTLVESDVFNICERVKEISPSLYIFAIDPPQQKGDRTYRYAVCEHCADGVERLVIRVEELDARLIDNLRYMLAVPMSERLDRLEAQEREADEKRKEDQLSEMYERIGRPMLTDLEKCGFITRPVSYPKSGAVGGRGSKRRS